MEGNKLNMFLSCLQSLREDFIGNKTNSLHICAAYFLAVIRQRYCLAFNKQGPYCV